MGDDENAPAKPTASGADWTKLSDFLPYGDHPPRLCVALNDPTNARFEATFAKMKRAKPKAGPKAPQEFGLELDVPQRDVFEEAQIASGQAIEDIAQWVEQRLKVGLGIGTWISQIGPLMQWAPAGGPEESWAQVISEMFLGVTYSGGSPTYAFGGPLERGADGSLKHIAGAREFRGGALFPWDSYFFSRIERTRSLRAADPFDIVSWQEPVKPTADSDPANDDPAIPIGTACQHLTTYAVLTRGFPLSCMGSATFPSVGLNANDGAWGMPAFGGATYTNKRTGIKYEGPKGKRILPHDKSLLEVKNAIANGMKPGSIVIYDTDRGAANADLAMNDYEIQKHGPDPVKIWGVYYKTRKSVADTDVDFADWTNPNRPSEHTADLAAAQAQVTTLEAKREAHPEKKLTKTDQSNLDKANQRVKDLQGKKSLDTIPRPHKVPCPGTRQYDGSHIYAILRVHPEKPYCQLLDVNQSDNPAALVEAGGDSLIARQGGQGIIDGARKRDYLYNDNNGFAGIGVLPDHTVTQEQVDFIRRARPVGFARLALSRRLPEEGKPARMMVNTDVLYVSKLFRLYDEGKTENHYISHLLWALRNSPGFTNVQPWWFVYVPRGLLAKCMWAHDARSMKIGDFLARHRPGGKLETSELLLNIVLTNEGRAPRSGHSALHCRYKSTPNGATTVAAFDPANSLPAPLMAYLNPEMMNVQDATRRSLAWDASYVNPKIKLDESKLPARFREGG
jgi:hypothetical protein